MKKLNLLILGLGLSTLGTTLFGSCDKFEVYSVDAPDNLKEKVDSIAGANNPQRGDTLKLDILTPNIGPDDNSAEWWTSFSDYFPIPANRLLRLVFINHTTGTDNWHNWNLAVTTADVRDGSNYSEYFVIRSDQYGWGNADYDEGLLKTDYAETLPGDDIWATFRQKMEGATVTMDIDHSRAGYVFVTAHHKAVDGTEFTETYEHPVSATDDIQAFLIVDHSHLNMLDAYTITSERQAVEDSEAVAISATGYPEAIEVGSTDFWGNAVATVTFADGSSTEVAFEDITFTLPDLTTTGEKTIIYTYNKTKQGNAGTPVSGYYTLTVNNPVTALQITKEPDVKTYYYYQDAIAPVNLHGIEIMATYGDGSQGVIPAANLQVSSLTPAAGEQKVEISYVGMTSTVTTSYSVNVIEGTGIVGLADCSTPWWTAFSEDKPVASGENLTFKMTLLSNGLNNWHAPCVILRDAALSEYAVVRMDNFGWGAGYDGNTNLVLESDWNWDIFGPMLNGSEITITVTNNGDDTANVHYDVVYPNGEIHFQSYKGISVNSADLQSALVCEGSCLILHD